MARLLQKHLLSNLADILRTQLPGSMKVYGLVRAIADGVCDMNVWVDDWPQFTAAVIQPTKNTSIPDYIRNVYTVYQIPGVDGSGCRSLLRHPSIIDWRSAIVFGGITDAVRKLIVLEAKALNVDIQIADACHLMQATKETLNTSEWLLPDGFTEGSLVPDNATLVTSRWTHSGPGAEEYIRQLITHFKTVSVHCGSGEPIGWFIVQNYGALGMLHVEPDYRNRGLGKYLVQRLAKIVIGEGDPAFVVVESDNEVSKQLHLKCGFRHLEGEDVQWVLSKPVGSCGKKWATCCV